jgi:tetratricopeptide (TPR) repeat protein
MPTGKIRRFPITIESIYKTGKKFLYCKENKKWNRAIKIFTDILKVEPAFYKAYYSRGDAHRRLNRYDLAIADYSEAIKLKPDYRDAYWERGDTWCEIEQFDNAISDYSQAIQLLSDDSCFIDWCWLYLNRGDAYFKKNQFALAIADYTESIKYNPERLPPDAHLDRGKAFLASWEADLSSERGYEHCELFNCKLKQAIADFTEAIRIENDNNNTYEGYAYDLAKAYLERGTAYYKAKKFEQALTDINLSLWVKPDYQKALSLKKILKKT